MKKDIIIIAAVALNDVIGIHGGLPWNIPSDTDFFRRKIKGHPTIVGTRTYKETAAALRANGITDQEFIVLTKNSWCDEKPGLRFAGSVEEALKKLKHAPKIFIAGGSCVYKEGVLHATRMLITRVQTAPLGDTYFPKMETWPKDWDWEDAPPSPAKKVWPEDEYPTSLETWIR